MEYLQPIGAKTVYDLQQKKIMGNVAKNDET